MKYLIALAVILGLLLALQKGCKFEPGKFRRSVIENREKRHQFQQQKKKDRWEKRWDLQPTDDPKKFKIINRRGRRKRGRE